MSVERMGVVFNHSRASGTAKVVLLGIANHDGDGGAWPSIATLTRYANVTERNVRKAIRELEQLGEVLVHVQAGGHARMPNYRRPNSYDVLVQCPDWCDNRTGQHRDLRTADVPLSAASPPVDSDPRPPVDNDPRPLSHPTVEPPREPPSEPPDEPSESALLPEVPHDRASTAGAGGEASPGETVLDLTLRVVEKLHQERIVLSPHHRAALVARLTPLRARWAETDLVNAIAIRDFSGATSPGAVLARRVGDLEQTESPTERAARDRNARSARQAAAIVPQRKPLAESTDAARERRRQLFESSKTTTTEENTDDVRHA